jgi:hypothetical protein
MKERIDARKKKFKVYFENPLSPFEILEFLFQSLLIVFYLYNFCYKLLLIKFLVKKKIKERYLKNVKKIYQFLTNLQQHYLKLSLNINLIENLNQIFRL